MLDGLDVIPLQIQNAQMDAFLQALDREYAIEGQIQFTQAMQPADAIHAQQLISGQGELKYLNFC